MEGIATIGRSALITAAAVLCLLAASPCETAAQTSIDTTRHLTGRGDPEADRLTAWSLDSVVVTGMPSPGKLQNALSPYTVINRQTIQSLGAVTLADALTQSLNIRLGNDGVLGATTSIGGLSGDKIKVLVDGLPLNGRENGNIDLSQLPLANVERIEIVQGPLSVVYGSDALGGVINLITKKAKKAWGGEANFLHESVGKNNVDGTLSHKWQSGHSISLQGGRNYFEGWKKIDTTTPQRVYLFKPKEQYFGNLTYSYVAPSASGMRISGAVDYLREKVTARGAAHVDPYEGFGIDEYYRVSRIISRLNVEKPLARIAGAKWNLQGSYALYGRTRERLRKNLVTLEEAPTTGTGDQDTSLFNDATLRGLYSGPLGKYTVFAGVEFNIQEGASGKIETGYASQSEIAAFATLSRKLLHDKLTLQGGLRGANHTLYKPPLIPSFNLLYAPVADWQIRASYARGYRAPSLKEQYLEFIDQNHHIVGNKELLAENSHAIQGSISKQFAGRAENYMQVVGSGWYNDVRNGISLVSEDPINATNINYTYGNIDRLRNVIGTLQGDGQYGALHLAGGYSLRHTLSQAGMYGAFTAAEWNARANVYLKSLKTSVDFFCKWTGAQPALVTDATTGSLTYGPRVGDFTMIDASIHRSIFSKMLTITCGLKNVLDIQTVGGSGNTVGGAHSSSDGSQSLLGRRVFIALRYSFGS